MVEMIVRVNRGHNRRFGNGPRGLHFQGRSRGLEVPLDDQRRVAAGNYAAPYCSKKCATVLMPW